jgi:hypothetical protein
MGDLADAVVSQQKDRQTRSKYRKEGMGSKSEVGKRKRIKAEIQTVWNKTGKRKERNR